LPRRQPGKEATGMNRRTAMFVTMLLGGLTPRGLLAQTPGRTASTKGRKGSLSLVPAGTKPAPRDEDGDDTAVEAERDEQTPKLPNDAGQKWRRYDITRYASLAHNQGAPQNAIVEWIFRRTGTAPWHGEKLAVLSASRTQIRVYHDEATLDMVDQVVERFLNATHDILSVRVRVVAAVDTRWRYAVYSRLTPVVSGPQGQQVWTLKTDDAAFVLAQMQVYQGFKLLVNQQYPMVNGQTLKVETTIGRAYAGSLQRDSAVGLGYQPKAEQLDEGFTLKLSPLLTFEGDTIEAAIELTANTVKQFHRTKIIAPREIGPSELFIDVPEVTETRLNQMVKDWPLGQTLLISAGIQPGILQDKNGFLNLRLPGTVPTSTELLVFLEAETVSRPRTTREPRDARETRE
jgi:hypothetical protein